MLGQDGNVKFQLQAELKMMKTVKFIFLRDIDQTFAIVHFSVDISNSQACCTR